MALIIQRLTRGTSRKFSHIRFGRRRPMPTIAITHGASVSAMAMFTAALRAAAAMSGWCEPDTKRMIIDLMNRRISDVNT